MSKSENTRAFIIERTAPVFNKKGFAGTSMSDLTEVTQLTKGGIYGNFESKDAVALAVFDHNLKQVNAVVDAEMKTAVSSREKLLVYARVYGNFANYPFPPGGCPVFNTAIESDDTHPELKKKARAALIGWKKGLEKLVRSGIENREFQAGVDPEQLALTIIALVEGGLVIARTMDKPAYQKLIMRSLENLIEGICRS